MEKQWVEFPVEDEELVQRLSGQIHVSSDIASLLINRGVDDFESARTFFRPSLQTLHDPFTMKDMDNAVNRISDAISKNEKILIYGDYDVDGTTSVALVFRFLRSYSDNLYFYVPDRYTEGYGLSKVGLEWAAAQDITLCIALDCGIKAVNMARYSGQLGIDLIICDHHLPGEELPEALAVLDPKRKDCEYPYKELSGCGVGFKLLQGFCIQNTIDLKSLYGLLDLVVVSIASDIVPITGENRTLAFYGLRKLNEQPLPGLKALIEISKLKGTISISDVVFYVGPRINATGRLTHARESVKLLIEDDPEVLGSATQHLNKTNTDRRDFDLSITKEALEMLEQDSTSTEAKSTVLFKNDWHKGVIGIVASRCTEHYYKPTIILTQSNGKATGSARSVTGFDIYEAIHRCADLLDQYGGHHHAAGLTLPVENVDLFRKKFEEVVSQSISEDQLTAKLWIDRRVDFDFINFKTYSIIRQMAPFGPGNMQPVFSTENVLLKHPPQVIKEDHLKLVVTQQKNDRTFPCIAFGMAAYADSLNVGNPFSIAYHIDENNYQGNKSLQLILKDIKF